MKTDKSVPLSEALSKHLQEETPDEETERTETDSHEGENKEKEKEKDNINIGDIEKDDLDYDSEFEDSDVAIAIKLNNNTDTSGEIRLVPFKRLSTISKIEDLIGLFNIDPTNMAGAFEDQLTLTIQSPLKDFEDEKYIIRLMDGMGEISINRDEFSKTISKQGTEVTNLDQASSKGLEGEEEKKEIDLSYLEMLNYEFRRMVKDEFFSRVLTKS